MRILQIFSIMLLSSLSLCAQNLDVEGEVKISNMSLDNSVDTVVVRLADGTLALREVSTFTGLQMISLSNDTIFLSNGGFIKLPAGFQSQTLEQVLVQDSSANNLRIKDLNDPLDPQDAATKAYVDELEANVDELEARLASLTVAPIAVDDNISFTADTFSVRNLDVLNGQSPDHDPDHDFRYGNYIQVTHSGSAPGANDNLTLQGRALVVNDNGTINDYADDFIEFTPDNFEKDSFYYVLTDLDGLKDTACVQVQLTAFERKLTASDAAAHDQFGRSVAISDDYAIVGAHYDDDGGSASGSAYIYFRSGTSWIEQAKLTASDAFTGDIFGESVGLSGDYTIVGASGKYNGGSNVGSAYIFKRSGTTWTEQAKLVASDAAVNDRFGESVSVSGDYAIVGARFNDDDGGNSGSAYIFMRSGTSWVEQAKITASDARQNDVFGCSVSISGDYAVVGAYSNDDNGSNSGSAYIFKRTGTTWTEQAKITASDAFKFDQFGWSVSISGDDAIIGTSASGSAYIFKRSGTSWIEQAIVTSSAYAGCFGQSVAINGDNVIIGASCDNEYGINSGSAFLFQRSGTSWYEKAKLTASDAVSSDYFGISVAVSSIYSLVGAIRNNDTGSAYIYSR